MPELPEVETIRRDLQTHIIGQAITDVFVYESRSVRGDTDEFVNALKGNAVTKIDRKGKFLFFILQDEKYLMAHLKMTGQFIFTQSDTMRPHTHTRVEIVFGDEGRLLFNDIRKFGFLHLLKEKSEVEEHLTKLGVDALTEEFTAEYFKDLLKRRKAPIKSLLLNQALVSGIGNIYADEICFHAGIHPTRPANTLSQADIEQIVMHTKRILFTSIENRGTSFRNYVDAKGESGNYVNHLKVFRRENQSCYVCHEQIFKMRLAGRGTHYCLKCQK